MNYFALLLSVIILSACGEENEPLNSRDKTIAALIGDAGEGRSIYESSCATCHGLDGLGTPTGNSLLDSTYTKEQTIGIILNGRGMMPNLAGLSDQEIANVTALSLQFQD